MQQQPQSVPQGPSRTGSVINKVKDARIETIYKISKFVDLIMAGLIVTQAIFRLVTADNFHTFTGFILTFYILIFGIGLCFIECNIMRARVWFYFMNYSLGRAIFYFVMTLLCFGSGASVNFFDIIVGIICGVVAIMFLFFHIWHRHSEHAHVQKLIEEMNAKRAKANANPTVLNVPAANRV